MTLDSGKVLNLFGYGRLADIAYSIAERVDEEENEDRKEALSQAMDDELIYTADQWEVIAGYSSPAEPMTLAEAAEEFFIDILSCVSD